MSSIRKFVVTCLTVTAILLALPAVSSAGHHEGDVTAEILKITYAAWKADMEKDLEAGMAILADDYTEFNSALPIRIDGKDMNGRFYEAFLQGSSEVIAAEAVNPKVQVYGDVAILTYNFVGYAKSAEGEVEPNLAKSTRVYAKIDGEWKLVHANFAAVSSDD
jgi:ketosteroid isomerase-like protein